MPGEATIVFVLQTLKEEWREYQDLSYGERREFEQLEEELGLLQAFLEDSGKHPEKTAFFKEKEKQIRNLVYEVEDTIEICLAKKAAAKAKPWSRITMKLSSGMAKQVRTLRQEKVRPILDYIKNEPTGRPTTHLRLDQSMGRKSVIVIENESNGQRSLSLTTAEDELISEQRSGSAKYQPHELDKVVDFEDEPTIIRYLMESKPKLDVIAIVGMPGLGKTTLARKIFNEEGICRKFPSRIWVPVSQKFNSRDTFLNILKELIPQAASTPSPSDEELITTIRRCLANKDFLLVMDDVWTVEDWKVIQKILPQENGKGKVLITSRQSEVAGQANIYRKPHQMSLLKVEKSLELLKLKVFDNIENCPPHIGRRIANKCGGLPLAVVVIAGSLKNQFTKTRAIVGLQEKWSKVFDDVNEILKEDEDGSISNVLELSYNILSDEMRVCFLYTGLFPDNHEIPASTLTQLWIEEGFVRPKGKSFEESAEKILEGRLINMNLLMVTRKNLDQVKTCGVHDLIREFCKAKAAEESLFRVIKESHQGETRAQVSEVQKFRRLCLQLNSVEAHYPVY